MSNIICQNIHPIILIISDSNSTFLTPDLKEQSQLEKSVESADISQNINFMCEEKGPISNSNNGDLI